MKLVNCLNWPSHSAYSEQTVAVRLGDYQILYFIYIKVFSCNSYDENKKTIFFKYLASEHKTYLLLVELWAEILCMQTLVHVISSIFLNSPAK